MDMAIEEMGKAIWTLIIFACVVTIAFIACLVLLILALTGVL